MPTVSHKWLRIRTHCPLLALCLNVVEEHKVKDIHLQDCAKSAQIVGLSGIKLMSFICHRSCSVKASVCATRESLTKFCKI